MSSIQDDELRPVLTAGQQQLACNPELNLDQEACCLEMEHLIRICFITSERSPNEFQHAITKLEEFYLPDSPTQITVPMLIGIYLKTKSQEVQLAITQRLAFYILQRWQCLDQAAVQGLETFVGQSINHLNIEGLLASESAKYTSSLLRVLTSMMVTYYGELQLVEGVLTEMRKFVAADKYATVALGLAVLESFLECLVS